MFFPLCWQLDDSSAAVRWAGLLLLLLQPGLNGAGQAVTTGG